MERARASMGVCPQFDVLWPTSPSANTSASSRGSGYPRVPRGVEADEKMAATGLTSKADRRAERSPVGKDARSPSPSRSSATRTSCFSTNPRRGWIRRVEGARGPRFVDSARNRRLRLAHHPLHGRGGSTLGSRRHHVPRTIGVRRITTLPQDRVRRRIHARRRRDCSTDRRRRGVITSSIIRGGTARPRGHRRGDTPRRSRRSRRFVSFPRRRDAHVRAPRVVRASFPATLAALKVPRKPRRSSVRGALRHARGSVPQRRRTTREM